jgi:hypothetical protein
LICLIVADERNPLEEIMGSMSDMVGVALTAEPPLSVAPSVVSVPQGEVVKLEPFLVKRILVLDGTLETV